MVDDNISPDQGRTSGTFLSEVPRAIQDMTANLGNLASERILNSFLPDMEDNEIEQIEHFKYKQDLERKLTVKSVVGLGFGLMGVVFGLSSTIWIPLCNGANVTILYGWMITAFFSTCVVLSLSEIISKFPTSGGVYHFSALLSNERYSLVSSWFTGWFLLIGNWTCLISIMFAGSQFILSIFGLKDIHYKEDIFLVLAVYFIVLGFSGFVNYKFSRYLDAINKLCILWTIYTVLAIDILLIFYAEKTHSIKEIFTNFDNSRSGWPAPIAFMVGMQSPSFALSGYGLIFSMTDEVKNPERNLPKGAVSAVLIASLTGIIFIIPILTILPALELVLDDTPAIMPIDLIFKFATKSYIISFLLAVLLIGTVVFQSIASLTTASRSTYAFARDGGLPFKDYWVEVSAIEESKVPKNALILSLCVCAVLCLLSLLSESAFNAFMGSSVITLSLANGIPIFCLMLNKRRKIQGAAFRLRKFGWIINFLSVLWVVFLFVILCLPLVIKHLTFGNMNYAIAVIVGFSGIASIGFRTWGCKSFNGPQIDTDYFELHNEDSTLRSNLDTVEDSFIVGIDDISDDDSASTASGALKAKSIPGPLPAHLAAS